MKDNFSFDASNNRGGKDPDEEMTVTEDKYDELLDDETLRMSEKVRRLLQDEGPQFSTVTLCALYIAFCTYAAKVLSDVLETTARHSNAEGAENTLLKVMKMLMVVEEKAGLSAKPKGALKKPLTLFVEGLLGCTQRIETAILCKKFLKCYNDETKI